jgi:hypothetical protein
MIQQIKDTHINLIEQIESFMRLSVMILGSLGIYFEEV